MIWTSPKPKSLGPRSSPSLVWVTLQLRQGGGLSGREGGSFLGTEALIMLLAGLSEVELAQMISSKGEASRQTFRLNTYCKPTQGS